MRRFKVLSTCTVIVLAFILTVSPSLSVSASDYVYNVPFPQPVTSDTRGYITLLLSNGSETFTNTLFWSIDPVVNVSQDKPTSLMDIRVSSDYISFNPYVAGGSPYYVSIYEYATAHNFTRNYFEYYDGSGTQTPFWQYYFSSINWEIIGYQFAGNVGELKSSLSYVNVPQINWNGDDSTAQFNYLVDILNKMEIMNSNLGGKLDTLISDFLDLLGKVDRSNMWLEGIHNWLVSVFMPELSQYMDTSSTYLFTIDEKLLQIHDQIDKFLEMSDADKEYVEDYQKFQDEQQQKIKEATDGSELYKPDIDPDDTLDNINFDDLSVYSAVLASAAKHPITITLLVLVMSLMLVSFILFGKRG